MSTAGLSRSMGVTIFCVGTLFLLTSCGSDDTIGSSTNVVAPGSATYVLQDARLEKIKKAITLDDLVALEPTIAKNPQKNHPKFVEFQKKQMILSSMLSTIESPEYQALQKDMATIYEGRALWNEELKTLDIKIRDVVQSLNKDTKADPEKGKQLKELTEKRNTLMKDFYATKEYNEYVTKNRSKITELSTQAAQYLPKEVKTLQEEIGKLAQEVSTPAKK